ncbi:MAG: hypothetical protein ABIF01_04085 [Candidatus Micrarchaeota archaeon]
MKGLFVLVLALIFVGFAWGSCESVVQKYVEEGENYSYINVSTMEKPGYLLFSINGKYSMLAFCGTSPRLVESREEMDAVLSSYSKVSQKPGDLVPSEEDTRGMISLLDKFAGSREKEAECKRYIGTDREPCVDRATCIKSCYTPMCSALKQSGECRTDGVGCEFIDAIVAYSNNLSVLDKGTARLREIILGLAKSSGTGALGEGIAVIDSMLASIDFVNSNPLVMEDVYYFCPRVSYDKESLWSLRGELVALRNKRALVITPGATSSFVAEETGRRLTLRENINRCSENLGYASKAIASIEGEKHPAVDYSDVKAPLDGMRTVNSELSSFCSERKFAEAGGAMNRFMEEESEALTALVNVSAEYDSVKALYSRVLVGVSSLPESENASALLESMKLVEREVGIVTSRSDLLVLRGVLLENEKQVLELSKPKQALQDWAIWPVLVAVAVTVLLYVLMKKTKRRGL